MDMHILLVHSAHLHAIIEASQVPSSLVRNTLNGKCVDLSVLCYFNTYVPTVYLYNGMSIGILAIVIARVSYFAG